MQVADQDGAGEVVGEPAEAQGARCKEARANEDGERGRELDPSALPTAASGRIAAATSAEIDPSGPMTSCREEPSRT
jgi:hypothetical protein